MAKKQVAGYILEKCPGCHPEASGRMPDVVQMAMAFFSEKCFLF